LLIVDCWCIADCWLLIADCWLLMHGARSRALLMHCFLILPCPRPSEVLDHMWLKICQWCWPRLKALSSAAITSCRLSHV
jgi:hypothetical protein